IMTNIVFTLVSAVLGVAMFALVAFSHAAEASPTASGGETKNGHVPGSVRSLSLLTIDDVRAPRATTGGMSSVGYRALSAPPTMQMASQISARSKSFMQM